MGLFAAPARCLQHAHTIRTHLRVSAALSSFLSLMALTIDLEVKLGRDVCTVHLIAKFHHHTFNRLEVIVLIDKQTEKQTHAAENIHLAPLCYVGG